MVVDFQEDFVSLSENQNIFSTLKKEFGLTENNPLYLNSYTSIDQYTGEISPVYLKDGLFYREDGSEFIPHEGSGIFVQRPRIAHQMGQYKIEPLDKLVSGGLVSLYGITRPSSSDYIDSSFGVVDSFTSNSKKDLSDPFLGRCNFHHIAFPDPKMMRKIIKVHFPEISSWISVRYCWQLHLPTRKHNYE